MKKPSQHTINEATKDIIEHCSITVDTLIDKYAIDRDQAEVLMALHGSLQQYGQRCQCGGTHTFKWHEGREDGLQDWWLCNSCGHEWQMFTIEDPVNDGQ
jgi:hypothetical protein